MKEELNITFRIPDRFINKVDGKYELSQNFPYESVVDYMKQYSILYYGINVDVKVEDIKLNRYEDDNRTWNFQYNWVDEPNYKEELIRVGNLRVKGPTELMKRPNRIFNSWMEYMEDNNNILSIYKNKICPKPTKVDIFKSMLRSVKDHLMLMK